MVSQRDDGHSVPEASESSKPSSLPMPANLSVLHLYSGNLYGGIETFLGTLARNAPLVPALKMEFALCFPGRLRDEIRAAGATVHDIGKVKFRRPWTIARARHRLARLVRERHYDFVFTHACWPHALFAPTLRRANRPILFWQHDIFGKAHWIEWLAARTRPTLVVSNSLTSAASLPGLFPGVPAEVIHYPVSAPSPSVDPEGDRAAIRRELDTPDEAVVVIQASRMERWKGQTLLLAALGQLREQPNWVAWIVGGAQRPRERIYLEELEARAKAAGIADRVRFPGQRTDVPRLLSAANVFCQPNIGPEPFGISFVEALYAGLPVVSTRQGGASEIVDESCGVLVEPGDAAALGEVLRRLIADSTDRTRLGRGGPARAAVLCDPKMILSRLASLLA